MLKTDRQPLVENAVSVRGLYERYAGMLLGYILEVVKDRKLADEYMVKLFCDISLQFNAVDWEGTNNWCKLQRLAQDKLANHSNHVRQHESPAGHGVMVQFAQNDYLERLTEEQRQVFCAIYYHRKAIADISKVLNITEDLTRKTLKEAFSIMKQGGKN